MAAVDVCSMSSAEFIGSDSMRQSVGLPGHCARCAARGHVRAHPSLGCADVGCNSSHPALDDQPEMPGKPVASVVTAKRNGPLIAAAASLWIRPGDRVADLTYGRGLFWTDYRPANLTAHDLATDGVDFRHLPEPDSSFDVVVFDPPYIAQGGRTTSTLPDFLDRYGLVDVPTTATAVMEMIAAGLKEASRVLAPRGRLLVKCMDYVNGGRLILGRHHVVTTCIGLGLEQVDEFIHHRGAGPQPKTNLDGSPRRQMRARRAHSYLCVFQAPPIGRHCQPEATA